MNLPTLVRHQGSVDARGGVAQQGEASRRQIAVLIPCYNESVVEFFTTGKITHFPTAILAAALEVMALVSATCGMVMDSINHHFRELSQLVLQASRTPAAAARQQGPSESD